MAATIKIKNSSTAGAAPTASDLVQGELAVNVTDKRLYTENASGTIVELGTNPSSITLPDGSASAPTLLHSGDTNTGLFFPAADTVGITTGGTERARVDSSGNLGLGVTPSAWGGSFKALQVGAVGSTYVSSAGDVIFGRNTYNNGTNSLYLTSNYASAYGMISGQHQWFTAASGTAGNAITFTQAMTLDASGNLGVGTTSPSYKLHVVGGQARIDVSAASTSLVCLGTGSNFQVDHSTSGYATLVNSANSGAAMIFKGSSESMRIDTSGRLLVGTTSQPSSSTKGFGVVPNSTVGYFIASGVSITTTCAHAEFYNPNGTVGSITTNSSSTTYATSSDYRLKENIAPMTGALATVAALKPCTYTWKATGEDGQGFIAHELQAVVPDAVVGEKDAVDEEGNPKYQGIDTSFLVATLVAAIQELKAEVDALKGTK